MATDHDCPLWCDRAHLNDPNDRDPIHERGGPVLAAVMRRVQLSSEGEAVVAAEGAEVRPVLFSRADRADETWLAVELGEHGPGITLTAETWRRLLPELETLLRAL